MLDYLPDHTDAEPPLIATDDPTDRAIPELARPRPGRAHRPPTTSATSCAPSSTTASILELRPGWAPHLVTALASVGGMPVGVVANQPRVLAGTLDIPASQKGARFVHFCDAFNLPIVTLVDTPGFLPGKDLEWRGMIRHGAELAFAYAEASVPRVCIVLRKAYGGAYIVMDSKGIGNDLCLAWPSAEIAVMGAPGAVQILNRNADEDERRAARGALRRRAPDPLGGGRAGLRRRGHRPRRDPAGAVPGPRPPGLAPRELLPGAKARRRPHVRTGRPCRPARPGASRVPDRPLPRTLGQGCPRLARLLGPIGGELIPRWEAR